MQNHSNIHDIEAWDRTTFDIDDILVAVRNTPSTPIWVEFKKLIREKFDSPLDVATIELGCGYGKFSLCANLIGCRTTLIDYNPPTVNQTNQIFLEFDCQADIQLQDVLSLPEEFQNRFDFSFSVGTAEHFLGFERLEIFKAHAQVLKPGGRALILVPNARCFPYRIAYSLRKISGRWPEGLPEVPFTKRELIEMGERAGLNKCRVVPCTYFWDDFYYWIGENIKSVFRKMTGYPRKKMPSEETIPPREELISSLLSPPPELTGFLDRHFAYSIALIGEK